MEQSPKPRQAHILEKYDTNLAGLTHIQVEERRKLHGLNALASQEKTYVLAQFISSFFEPMNLILFCASIISLIIGEITDASIILFIVLFSSVLGFFQEQAAQRALEKLRAQVATTATVIRDNTKQEIRVDQLTVGDIVKLSCGDIIPADCILLHSDDFFVNESSITGESFPVEKSADVPDEKQSKLFMGTNVISGSATAVVIGIGLNTEFGKVSASLAAAPPKSDYELGVASFGVFILKISVYLVLLIFVINAFKEGSIVQALLFAVAIAVGVVPELLPMIMTVTMAMGAQRMAKRGVLVKQLSAIPNFGSMNVLCTDKTGTLTENKIALVKHVAIDGKQSESVLLATFLTSYFQTGIKSPMDDAVLAYAHPSVSAFKKTDEIPYDFVRKRMSVAVQSKKRVELICKGAPEELLKLCTTVQAKKQVKFTKAKLEQAQMLYDDLSGQGFRVLAVASKTVRGPGVTKKDESNFTFLGFVAFLDPAKKDVIEVVKQLNDLGIAMKVITGDNEIVSAKICNDVGIPCQNVMLGTDVDALSDDALSVKACQTTVFARCSPDQKNRIIMALKKAGCVVGYMGDGINDAPSLKSADVGISVNNAVDIAKEAAQIVLTSKSLGELRDGVLEGRKTFANSMKYMLMACSSNLGNMFSTTIVLLYLPFLPMLPIQIILNNFIYDFSQITIPSDSVDEEWTLKPRRWNLEFIKKYMMFFGPLSSLFDIILIVILFEFLHVQSGILQTAWFMFSLATQTLGIWIIRTQHSPFKSKPSLPVAMTSILGLGLGWLLPYTTFALIFKFQPLPLTVIGIIVGVLVAYLSALELMKRWFYKRYAY
ncbi:MAG TPA: magnesium-translocating P-type ATPase [Acidobacteriota bacterium]|nr:magnesium-translocating P-type ATPase [Acidobacteriota bacterium]